MFISQRASGCAGRGSGCLLLRTSLRVFPDASSIVSSRLRGLLYKLTDKSLKAGLVLPSIIILENVWAVEVMPAVFLLSGRGLASGFCRALPSLRFGISSFSQKTQSELETGNVNMCFGFGM